MQTKALLWLIVIIIYVVKDSDEVRIKMCNLCKLRYENVLINLYPAIRLKLIDNGKWK